MDIDMEEQYKAPWTGQRLVVDKFTAERWSIRASETMRNSKKRHEEQAAYAL
jgi:hypothetical protein